MSDCLHNPASFVFEYENPFWFVACTKCNLRGRTADDESTAIIFWQNEELIENNLTGGRLNRYLPSSCMCSHEDGKMTVCEIGWIFYCTKCRAHTPIVETLVEAKRMWDDGVILDINEGNISNIAELKRVIRYLKYCLGYTRSFWDLFITDKSQRRVIAKNIKYQLNHMYRICCDFIGDVIDDSIIMPRNAISDVELIKDDNSLDSWAKKL